MAGNTRLGEAKANKKDEFYTQLTDIEKELRHHQAHFAGKTVLCNCDDPFESCFFKYFALNFDFLGLKKLIATSYVGSPVAGRQLSLFEEPVSGRAGKAYRAIVTTVHDTKGDGSVDMLDVAELFRRRENELSELAGDGDFRSPECLALLDEADVVVTNPPFSLFRKYVATLMARDKKFLIIGNQNAITYKEIFPLLMSGKMWIGPSIHSGDCAFWVPDDYPLDATSCGVDPQTGRKFIRVKGVRWFTNLDTKQRHEEMILFRRYDPEAYPKYDNYDAIEVGERRDIPCDYPGIMGVPITFLDKYCPDQFEIVGITESWSGGTTKTYPKQTQIGRHGTTSIVTKLNDGPALVAPVPPKDKTYYIVSGRTYIKTYSRVLIRNRHPEEAK